MNRLEQLVHGRAPLPKVSEHRRARMLADSKKRQARDHHRRETIRLREMAAREARAGY